MMKRVYSTVSQLKPNVCIVGSGPAGFYCAQQILKLLPQSTVDIYEKLPVPFGLVRYGVAPDHPEVKNVINTFTKTGDNPRVNFYGNVCLGQDISLGDLRNAYHAVVLTYGADNDKKLNIPGEDGKNIISARSFVGWYNGLPEDASLDLSLDCEEATILGQGNVAMDVARILLSPVDQLKEFREMTKLPHVQTVFRNEQLCGVHEASAKLILKTSNPDESKSNCSKYFRPIFLRSPTEFKLDDNGAITGINFAVNRLEGPLDNQRALVTEDTELIPSRIAFRSIGYQSRCVDPDIPFNEKSCTVIPKEYIYSAGWLATGPVGVILSTMSNAFEVGQRIGQDFQSGRLNSDTKKPGSDFILDIVRSKGVPVVTWEGWKAIDKEETGRGKLKGKPREKIISIEEMISVSGNS
ncbi:hypothetical protein M8J75_011144 [Diaphorina citri]|nr:hypothetical protein M8J75_011144 [Diaphorina citri]